MTTDNKKNNGEWKQCRTELKAHIYMEEKNSTGEYMQIKPIHFWIHKDILNAICKYINKFTSESEYNLVEE